MRTRRDILTHFGLGAAGCALGGQSAAAHTRRATLQAFAQGHSESAQPWWLLEPLSEGDVVGAGWKIESLSPVRQGAAVLTLRHPRRGNLPIHICIHNGAPRGYAHTELFDLIVMDGGRGTGIVEPELEEVFHHIAEQILSNELRDDQSARVYDIERMMTHAERVQTFGPTPLQERP